MIKSIRSISLKSLRFVGPTKRLIREFPRDARKTAGLELLRVQEGEMPLDWKPMHTIASGVYEIRIHKPLEHRVIYIAKFPEAIYVLHAFEKKTRETPQKEIETARRHYAEVQNERKT